MRAIQRSDRPLLSATSAILILVFSCVLSTARILHRAPVPGHLEVDHVAQRSDQRFTAMKGTLPDRGVIGYIGADDMDGTADYYLAQYALAPRIIDRSSGHPLVIGNCPHGSPQLPPSGLTLVKDFGDGVLLFSNKDGK